MTPEYEQQIIDSAAPNGTILLQDIRIDAWMIVKALRGLCNKVYADDLDDLTYADRVAAAVLSSYLKEIFPVIDYDKKKSS